MPRFKSLQFCINSCDDFGVFDVSKFVSTPRMTSREHSLNLHFGVRGPGADAKKFRLGSLFTRAVDFQGNASPGKSSAICSQDSNENRTSQCPTSIQLPAPRRRWDVDQPRDVVCTMTAKLQHQETVPQMNLLITNRIGLRN